MRSATPLQSSPTRYFVDPSLAVAAFGQGPTQLLGDLNATGFFFENLVVRDVRIYAQRLGGQVHHWRDQNQNEVDVVVTLPDGRWGAFEVKMNPVGCDKAAASLLSFAEKVDQGKAGAASGTGRHHVDWLRVQPPRRSQRSSHRHTRTLSTKVLGSTLAQRC